MPTSVAQRVAQPGFTFIELMIVIAITGVLGTLAFSAYNTYSIRRQIIEGIDLATSMKAPIIDAFIAMGEAPSDRLAAGVAMPTDTPLNKYVTEMNVNDGRIDIRFGNQANETITDRTLSLTPYEAADLEVVWICGNHIPSQGLNPLGFSGGGRQAVQIPATIESRYLPSYCR